MKLPIDDIRAHARSANSRPLAEREDGTFEPSTGGASRLSAVPQFTDEYVDPLEELELGEDAPHFNERLVDGFALLGMDDV